MPENQEQSTDGKPRQIPAQEGLFHQPESPGDQPYLIGNRCRECGFVSFPKLMTCPRCVKKGTMEEYHLARRGKVDMFASCFAALPGFKAPSVQGYITLEDGGRLWSLITGVNAEDTGAIKTGDEVELVIEKLRDDADGSEVMSYKFRPVAVESKGKD